MPPQKGLYMVTYTNITQNHGTYVITGYVTSKHNINFTSIGIRDPIITRIILRNIIQHLTIGQSGQATYGKKSKDRVKYYISFPRHVYREDVILRSWHHYDVICIPYTYVNATKKEYPTVLKYHTTYFNTVSFSTFAWNDNITHHFNS